MYTCTYKTLSVFIIFRTKLSDVDNLILSMSDSSLSYGQFEWVDSHLVTALTQGYWLIIAQANLCRYHYY